MKHAACFCGQQYGKYGRAAESDCNVKCYGDERQICGGDYRNSVYSSEGFFDVVFFFKFSFLHIVLKEK